MACKKIQASYGILDILNAEGEYGILKVLKYWSVKYKNKLSIHLSLNGYVYSKCLTML